MLAHPTLDQLNALGLYGLAKGFKELENKAEARSLDHAEWLGLLLEYEMILDRVIHNAYRIDLTGDSLRKPRPNA